MSQERESKYFWPLRLLPWDALQTSSNTLFQPAPGCKVIGFIPVYESMDACKADYPDAEVCEAYPEPPKE